MSSLMVFLLSWGMATVSIAIGLNRFGGRKPLHQDVQLVIATNRPVRLERVRYRDEATYLRSMLDSSRN